MYQKPQSYKVWFLAHGVRQFFFPFTPLTTWKNQNFEKKKKKPFRGVIILHMCTENHDYMIYAFWDVKCGRINVWWFCATFSPFIVLHMYHKWRSYDVCYLKCKAQQIKVFVILGHFLPSDPPTNNKNPNFEKLK